MGTHLFFDVDKETPVDELYCKCNNYYKYVARTNKVLKMSRVLLQDKTAEAQIDHENEILDKLKVTKNYTEALNMFLAPGREPPRRIPQEFNCENLVMLESGGCDATAPTNDTEENNPTETMRKGDS